MRCLVRVMAIAALPCLWCGVTSGFTSERAIVEAESPVGMAGRIEQIVIPGSEVEVKPIADRSPIVLRILDSFPHGSDFRYDFEFVGLEPGEYSLAEFLKRKDGSPLEDLPPMTVLITGVLPEGQILPNALQHEEVRGLGGYQRFAWFAVGVWGVGLLLLIFSCVRKRKGPVGTAVHPQTLADRLEPMVEQAIAGKLPTPMLAELEMMLVAFWRKRLRLEDRDAASVIPELRRHEQAGPLLSQLEVWLHRPGQDDSIDVAELLNPYRSLPPDALEIPDEAAVR